MPPPNRPYRAAPPLPRAITLLSELTDSQFAAFLQEVRGKRAFDSDSARVDALTKTLELDQTADAIILLAGCEFLYDRAHEWAANGRDIIDVTRDLLQFAGLWPRPSADSGIILHRLSAVLRPNPVRDREVKRQWLQTGILDIATGFASFVDLRPNFSSDRSAITELMPIVIFNIMIQTEDGNEKSCVFQLSEQSLQRLEDAISDARLKLSRVREHPILSPLLFAASSSETGHE